MKEIEENHENERRSRLATLIVVLVCAVPLLSTIAYGAVDSWAIGLLAVIVTVIALMWIADSTVAGGFRFSSNPLQLSIIGLIAIAAIQLVPVWPSSAAELVSVPVASTLSMDPYATRLFLMRLLILFVFFATALTFVPGGSRPKRIAIAIIVFGAFAAFFGILQKLTTPEAIYGLRPTPQAFPFGPFVNQHHFAALMEMTSGLALGLLFGSGVARDRKIFLAIAAGIMGMAIVFTGSRGGMISYSGVIIFVALASFVRPQGRARGEEGSARNRNLLVIISAIGLLLLVVGSVSFLGGGIELLRGIGVENATDATSGRSHFWSIAWQVFLDHPILGAGFDAFGVAFTRYDTWNGMFRVEQVHNDYLQTLSDGGLIAFLCVIAFLLMLFRNGIKAIGNRSNPLARSIATGALAGCFGILIHSFFDFPLRTTANAFVFLLLVVLATETAPSRGRR